MSKQHSPDKTPRNARTTAERLRLLFSWREHLEREGAGTDRKTAAARRTASREIATTRGEARATLERLAAELRNVLVANEQRPGNLVIEEKLGRLRHEMAQFNWLLKADSSAQLGGAIALPVSQYPVVLGFDRPPIPLRLDRDDFITLVVAALIIVGSCLGIFWYHLWREDVTFTLERPGPGQISVNFLNDSSFITNFYGPWPESDTGLERRSFGIELYCRGRDSESFQECTSIRDVWTYLGQGISPLKPVQVESGVMIAIQLDLAALEKQYGAELAEVRIHGGSRRNRNDFVFTESLAAP